MIPESYLMHHGVDGQQWGIQNGPPYPLDRAGRRALRAQKKQAKKDQKNEINRIQRDQVETERVLTKYNQNLPTAYTYGDLFDPRMKSTSDYELDYINRRLQLEKNYKDLQESEISRGRRETSDSIKKLAMGGVAVSTLAGVAGLIVGAKNPEASKVLKTIGAVGSTINGGLLSFASLNNYSDRVNR